MSARSRDAPARSVDCPPDHLMAAPPGPAVERLTTCAEALTALVRRQASTAIRIRNFTLMSDSLLRPPVGNLAITVEQPICPSYLLGKTAGRSRGGESVFT